MIDKVSVEKTLVEEIHLYNLDLEANHIYLVGSDDYIAHDMPGEPGVEYSMASKFIKNLNIIMFRNPDPILIHMKTCGGEWEEGISIYDMLKSCPNKTTILNYTHARSMSSLIFQAADKRVMMPNSTFMFHEGTVELSGTGKVFRTDYVEHMKTMETMLNIYIDSMKRKGKMQKRPRAEIKKWLTEQMDKKEDVYLTAKQAVEYGFADEIFGRNGKYNWNKLLED